MQILFSKNITILDTTKGRVTKLYLKQVKFGKITPLFNNLEITGFQPGMSDRFAICTLGNS